VAAGDYLVRACPTWAWQAGEVAKARAYLPPGKQFLVTRSVPCFRRATELERSAGAEEALLTGDDAGWVATHGGGSGSGGPGGAEEIPEMDAAGGAAGASGAAGAAGSDDDDAPDIETLELEEDEATLVTAVPSTSGGGGGGDAIRRTRTYDLSITYDQYYQVPRFWLVGADERGRPLPPAAVLQDVSEEHARKTVTVDPHPHLPVSAASIHPCRRGTRRARS